MIVPVYITPIQGPDNYDNVVSTNSNYQYLVCQCSRHVFIYVTIILLRVFLQFAFFSSDKLIANLLYFVTCNKFVL